MSEPVSRAVSRELTRKANSLPDVCYQTHPIEIRRRLRGSQGKKRGVATGATLQSRQPTRCKHQAFEVSAHSLTPVSCSHQSQFALTGKGPEVANVPVYMRYTDSNWLARSPCRPEPEATQPHVTQVPKHPCYRPSPLSSIMYHPMQCMY